MGFEFNSVRVDLVWLVFRDWFVMVFMDIYVDWEFYFVQWFRVFRFLRFFPGLDIRVVFEDILVDSDILNVIR